MHIAQKYSKFITVITLYGWLPFPSKTTHQHSSINDSPGEGITKSICKSNT